MHPGSATETNQMVRCLLLALLCPRLAPVVRNTTPAGRRVQIQQSIKQGIKHTCSRRPARALRPNADSAILSKA
jgi:hypothetical protein